MTHEDRWKTNVSVEKCEDSAALAQHNRELLNIPRNVAATLGSETVEIVAMGGYTNALGRRVELTDALDRSVASKVSLPPDAPLPGPPQALHDRLTVQVCNRTTLEAAHTLAMDGKHVLALNFASPTRPGGGFLSGARAQEEALARSSGLYATLDGDAMYAHHIHLYDPIATEWAILSPDVPIFRTDDGVFLEEPWVCTVLTCAATQAKRMMGGDPTAAMHRRIDRVLAIAWAYGYDTLVLGAWGCGAFGNDPAAVAGLFRDALLGPYLGAFQRIVFAITDWSPERRFLAPFCDAFQNFADSKG